MSTLEIAAGSTVTLRRTITVSGVPLTGATVRVDVVRLDGLVLDWSDATFKAIGSVVTRYQTLTEVSAANFPGRYSTTWDTSTITNATTPDAYLVTYYETAPSAYTLDQDEYLVGAFISTRASATALALVQTDVDDIQTRLPAALVSGRMDASVGAMQADTLTASALAASAVAEIADGVWDEAAAGHAIAGTFGAILGTNLDVTLAALGASLTAIKGVGFTAGQDDLHAIRARGDVAWITATGFATPTNVTDSTATLTALINAVPASVWSTAYGTPSANTFGWLLYRLGQWGTEICQKKIVGQNLLLQSIGGVTTFATVPLKDITGGVITPTAGDPAQFLPT